MKKRIMKNVLLVLVGIGSISVLVSCQEIAALFGASSVWVEIENDGYTNTADGITIDADIEVKLRDVSLDNYKVYKLDGEGNKGDEVSSVKISKGSIETIVVEWGGYDYKPGFKVELRNKDTDERYESKSIECNALVKSQVQYNLKDLKLKRI